MSAARVTSVCMFVVGSLFLQTALSRGRYQCHCSEGCSGEIKENPCASCEKGYYGRFCQTENVAFKRTANQSRSCPGYEGEAYLAVDGDERTDFIDFSPFHCTCSMDSPRFWRIDLGKPYPLHKIRIYQRNTLHRRLVGFYIEIDGQECYRWPNKTYPQTVFNVICDKHGQDVVLKLPFRGSDNVLTLCEVQVFVCTDFWYGDGCDRTCNCANETEVCDKNTGSCTDCPDGWTGTACDSCNDGYYGPSCIACGHCLNNESCNQETGTCEHGCRNGWKLPLCDLCTDGYWGSTCAKCGQCQTGDVCNKTTGHCQQCQSGWALPACTFCTDFWYGDGCDRTCNCANETEVCDKNTGSCTDCPDGWIGTACDRCADSYYGPSCIACGHCLNNKSCNQVTGKCENGCRNGWELPRCDLCTDGYWGLTCAKCGQCQTGDVCNKTSGHCQQCQSGWALPTCTSCQRGLYGGICNETCGHCKGGNSTCDISNGHCSTGCDAGWMGNICKTECEEGHYGEDCVHVCKNCKEGHCDTAVGCTEYIAASNDYVTVGVAVGGSVAAVCVVVAALAVLFIWRRHKASLQEQSPKKDTAMVQGLEQLPNDLVDDGTGQQQLEHNMTDDDETEISEQQPSANLEDNVYMNFTNTEIPVEKLYSYIQSKTDKNFKNEYLLLPSGLQAPHDIGKKPINKKKNRYLTTYPYDHSRVTLKMAGTEDSDYINANYIDSYRKTKAYIATQGPVANTTTDFWRMIREQNITKIVMLTNVFENGKKKCEQYWPDMSSVKMIGEMEVACLNVNERADYTIREFKINTKEDAATQTVKIFHFTTWPDHGVPSAPALLAFWKQVKKKTEPCGPITVHCSAGIGRTGTFIGLDSLIEEARDTNTVNVFQFVRKMRDNRVNMVQTAEQYTFLHEVLLEGISSVKTLYTIDSFKEECFKEAVNNSSLQKEFNDLTRLNKPVSQADIDTAMLPENKRKNRFSTIVPVSSQRPLLSTPVEGTNDYINAVILPSCTNKNGFLVTQLPLELTVVDFWRMVHEHDCRTIVSLTGETTENNTVYWPSQDESKTIGPFTINNQGPIPCSGSIREISLTLTKDSTYENMEDKDIKLFILNNWYNGDDLPPSDKYELLMFLDKLERGREQTGKSPIVVQCIDGAKHSGLFCVLSNIIEKLKLDKDVDIFVTVRELQCIRPQIVSSLQQYQYCHEVVKEYLSSLEIYHNL